MGSPSPGGLLIDLYYRACNDVQASALRCFAGADCVVYSLWLKQ